MISKLYSMLGMGKRAGLIVLGETGCIQSIKKNKSKLIIISEDATDNTKEKIISLCKKNNVEYHIVGEKEELGHAVGKSLSSIISITDSKFSKVIADIINKNKQ